MRCNDRLLEHQTPIDPSMNLPHTVEQACGQCTRRCQRRMALPLVIAFLLSALASFELFADESLLPPAGGAPVLRLETNGPRSHVNALEFSPDGKRLYSVGWDKAVQIWDQNDVGKFQYNPKATLRTPIGPGIHGQLFTLATTEDGRWLATAGVGLVRELAGERESGWIQPAGNLSLESQLDYGLIYVFDTLTGTTKLLRGHRGNVWSLAFAHGRPPAAPSLVSIAEDRTDDLTKFVPTVRLWDVVTSSEITQLKAVPNLEGKAWGPLPNLDGAQPGLTAWTTGPDRNEARVALAWGDNQFRVWDTKSGQVSVIQASKSTWTVLPLDRKRERILTGGNSQLGVWQLANTPAGHLAALSSTQFQDSQIESLRGQRMDGNVSAAALIPSTNTQPARAAFVVTRFDTIPYSYRLLIATTDSPIQAIREIELPWTGIRRPSIAVSRDGRSLALAGHERAEIEVYATEDLIGGKPLNPQRLGSEALRFQDAQFVRCDDRWGLRLSQSRRGDAESPNTNPMIFDINHRDIQSPNAQWRVANVTKSGWSVVDYRTPGKVIVNRPDDSKNLELSLDDQFALTAIAFCPKPFGCPVPLLAIASQRQGESRLQLFNGATGEHVRQFTGHTEVIRSLSFSEDGRMLLSAADDRTVSVWTIVDLAERNLGKRGMIRGLSVQEIANKLVVKSTHPEIDLRREDEIVAGVQQGEVVEFGSKKEFHKFIRDRKPGETVEFTVRRDGQVKAMTCPVDQAIDEAKPLFTLFVIPSENGPEWEWIGWNPLGFFDSRGDRIDQWLGWHFNTGEPERPATFAVVGEYRDKFFNRGMLQKLIELQKLPPAQPIAPDEPKVTFFLRHPDGTPLRLDYDDVPQLETNQVEIVAEVNGVAPRRMHEIKLQVVVENNDRSNQTTINFQRDRESEDWVANLTNYPWTRGPHRLVVQLETSERTVRCIGRADYHPAAPEIDWNIDPTWKRDFKAAEITVNATVTPTGDEADVQLLLLRPGIENPLVIRSWKAQSQLQIDESVTIDPGENRLELVTWNRNAPPEDRELETTRILTFVRRSNPPTAPTIEVDDKIVALDATGQTKTLTADPDAPDTFRTASPRVRFRGNITGQASLDSAALMLAGELQTLAGFDPGQDRVVTFDQTLALKPGPNSVILKSSIGDAQSEKRLLFVYEPPAPQLVEMTESVKEIDALPPGLVRIPHVFYSRYHEPIATVSARLEGLLEHSYRLTLRINGIVLNDNLRIDRSRPDQHHLELAIPLEGGINQISIQVQNDWSRETESKQLELRFLRVPEIVSAEVPVKLIEKPLELNCLIQSVIPLRSARIVVDDTNEIPGTLSEVAGQPGNYLLQAHRTGIAHGKHLIQITATNDEGSNLVPSLHEMTVEQPIAPPRIEIVGPISSTPSPSKLFAVQYSVKSVAPTTVKTRCQGAAQGEVRTSSIDVVPIDGSTGILNIELFDGPNEIELIAHNSGGYSEKQIVTTSYVTHPASVEIVSIDGQRPRWRDGKGVLDSSATKARIKLQGKLKLNSRPDIAQNLKARVWVNGFLQTTNVIMDSEGATTGTFATELTLGRPKKNEIKVEVYGDSGQLPSLLDAPKSLTLDCDKHERHQDLYLMLLGTGDADVLRESAMKALHAQTDARRSAEETWESELFSNVHVFSALNVRPLKANTRLDHLVNRMKDNRRRSSSSGAHTILMIYFQGRIHLTGEDFKFITYDKQSPSEESVTGKDLQRTLNDTYGAHLLFLDLNQNDQSVTLQDVWPKAPQLGIVISNWMGQEQQPGETRLISALTHALPQIRLVRELASTIDDRFRSAREHFPGRIEARVDLLKEVQDVRIGVE